MVQSPRQALEAALRNPDYVDISDLPNVKVDLRYGTKRNLLNRDVYDGFQRALLHKDAAGKFAHASCLLALHHPTWKYIVFDSLRPQPAQREFWSLVKGTPREPFFADPEKGSLHSFGFAIDLGLLDEEGRELDMGTGFDDLSDLAGPMHEERMLSEGRLLEHQRRNRLILRELMEESGFLQLPREWWHYDALPGSEVRARYRLCE